MRKTYYELSKQIVERKKLMTPKPRKNYPVKMILLVTFGILALPAGIIFGFNKESSAAAKIAKKYEMIVLPCDDMEYRQAASFVEKVFVEFSVKGDEGVRKYWLVNDSFHGEKFDSELAKLKNFRGGNPAVREIRKYAGWPDFYKVFFREPELEKEIIFNIGKSPEKGLLISSIE